MQVLPYARTIAAFMMTIFFIKSVGMLFGCGKTVALSSSMIPQSTASSLILSFCSRSSEDRGNKILKLLWIGIVQHHGKSAWKNYNENINSYPLISLRITSVLLAQRNAKDSDHLEQKQNAVGQNDKTRRYPWKFHTLMQYSPGELLQTAKTFLWISSPCSWVLKGNEAEEYLNMTSNTSGSKLRLLFNAFGQVGTPILKYLIGLRKYHRDKLESIGWFLESIVQQNKAGKQADWRTFPTDELDVAIWQLFSPIFTKIRFWAAYFHCCNHLLHGCMHFIAAALFVSYGLTGRDDHLPVNLITQLFLIEGEIIPRE